MPDIRYVCLSDTHFGADNSLLTFLAPGARSADPMQQSPVLTQLVSCLRSLIASNQRGEKPMLILNGDILELALTTDNRAVMAFERFLEQAFPRGGDALFQKVIYYLPGNHDHHLWETAREDQYRRYMEYMGRKEPGKPLEPPWHATNLLINKLHEKPCPATYLNALAQRCGVPDVSFMTAYPNLGLVSGDDRRAVLFTHGHFSESIYMLVTSLMTMVFPQRIKPVNVWDYEAENFAWIDFFWSALGRSGQAGQDVELIYDRMQDPEAFSRLLQNLAVGLSERFKLSGLLGWFKSRLMKSMLRMIMEQILKVESRHKDEPLSPDTVTSLKQYMEGPLLLQVLSERRSMPAEVTFVFGHTHKPFEQVKPYEGYTEHVKLYNSGGWVVDSLDKKTPAGWAVVLLDENLNAVSLRASGSFEESSVCVAQATASGAPANPLYERLMPLVDGKKEPWSSFTKAVDVSTKIHWENLDAKIHGAK